MPNGKAELYFPHTCGGYMPDNEGRNALINFISEHLETLLTLLAVVFSAISGVYVYANKVISRTCSWIKRMAALPQMVEAIHAELREAAKEPLHQYLTTLQAQMNGINDRIGAEWAKNRAMADIILDKACAEMDTTGAVIWHNHAMASLFGHFRNLYGHSWRNLIHIEDRSELDYLLQNAITTHSSLEISLRYNSDAQTRLKIDLRPIITHDNKFMGFLSFFSFQPGEAEPTSPSSSKHNEL